jgi:hypothetical protein
MVGCCTNYCKVGDVLNRGSSQLVVVSGGDNFSVSVWGSKQETANLELVSQAENLVTVPTQTLPYFHALLPTVDATGLDILKLSLHVNNGKPSLLFRLSQYSAESGSWTTNTQLIEDSLADNRRYFHLKWIRCRYETSVHETDNALLEVFSYYGMIGIRLFASEDSNRPWAYKEVGQQQYLGQTSIGAGLGAYGDWAQGILTWGSQSQDFADLTEWIPDGSVNHSGGSWGMRQGDTNRAHIPGWDVTRRPGYYEEEGRET